MGVGNPVIVGENHVVRLRAGVDGGKAERVHGRSLERSIQGTTEEILGSALGIITTGKHVDLGATSVSCRNVSPSAER